MIIKLMKIVKFVMINAFLVMMILKIAQNFVAINVKVVIIMILMINVMNAYSIDKMPLNVPVH